MPALSFAIKLSVLTQMNQKPPIIAIVGPPNVGKSTLFNKILGQQTAVTSEVAGTTRDRQYAAVNWNGKRFILADTAGLDAKAGTELETNVQKQIQRALKEAAVIVMTVDGKQPPGALDKQVLDSFRRLKTKKILAVNKIDSPKNPGLAEAEFARLGIKPIFPVSALTGRGIGDMLDEITRLIDYKAPDKTETQGLSGQIAVSIVGKPNVGKSSLFNKILNDERAVVSSLPGTTRTAVDEAIVIDGQDYLFIDTAGLKKKEHRQQKPDVFSAFQTFKSIRKSDVCLLVLDAVEGISAQDQKIARKILDMQKGCIIAANKIDLFSASEKRAELGRRAARPGKNQADNRYQSLRDYISHHFPFLWMCPVFFVSAQTGEGLMPAVKAIKAISQARQKIVIDEDLEKFLAKKLQTHPPKLLRDQKKPKVYGLRQLGANPPTFELAVNHPAAISTQFKRYLENSIIKELDFWGTPIKLHLKKKIG